MRMPDASYSSHGWIERVPSYSSVADDPSRGRPEIACSLLGVSSWKAFEHPNDLVTRIAGVSAGQINQRGKS